MELVRYISISFLVYQEVDLIFLLENSVLCMAGQWYATSHSPDETFYQGRSECFLFDSINAVLALLMSLKERPSKKDDS